MIKKSDLGIKRSRGERFFITSMQNITSLLFLFIVDVKHNLRLILTIYNPYTYYIM